MKRRDAGDGVVDGVAAAAALPQDLMVFEACDGVFGYCSPFPEPFVGPIFDDAAVWSATWCSDL
ncbi:hypothetical protein, partial [Streptomyces sp. NPDC047009]|uniref:hypothetical protein n=1 Tax=unclassified Streptomyces TaxID=2593676 RepID=UPI00340AC874